jgi:hypothetical protein
VLVWLNFEQPKTQKQDASSIPYAVQFLGYPPASGIQASFEIPFVSKQELRNGLFGSGGFFFVAFIVLTALVLFFILLMLFLGLGLGF